MSDSAWVVDVDEQTFEAEVVRRSADVPVVVDFWAPWCGPCRMLGPLLEQLAAERDGGFVLAKVNTDENPGLSQTFGIRGIPAVKAFVGGVEVDGFVGVQTRPFIETMLGRLAPSDGAKLAAEGKRLLEAGDIDGSLESFRDAMAQGMSDSNVLLGLAEALFRAGHLDDAADTVSDIREGEDGWDDAQALLLVLRMLRTADALGGAAAARARLAADERDLEARYALAGVHLSQGEVEQALEALLEIVRLDKTWNDAAGRKGMLAIFQRIGARSPLADRFRGLLARTLY